MSKMIVLGAGASIGAKKIGKGWILGDRPVPGAKQFFNDVSYLPSREAPYDYLNIFGLTYEGAHELVRQAFQIKNQWFNPKEWKNVDIEELLTFLDIGVKMYTMNSSYQKVFKQAKDSVIDFASMQILFRSIGQRCDYLTNLFSKLNYNDIILSFNWDTLADSSLDYLNHTIYKNYLNITNNFNFKISEFQDKGVLLKLHGSINWQYYENRKCYDYKKMKLLHLNNSVLKLSVKDFDKKCICGNRFKIMLIPPVTNKSIIHKNSFFNKIWRLAKNRIPIVDEIIFIGYSFPRTDFYSDWLFRQVNFLTNRKKKIIIINPETENKRSELMRKYKNIFKGLDIKTYKYLKDYLK